MKASTTGSQSVAHSSEVSLVVQTFGEMAKRHADQIAIVDVSGQCLTYQELDQQSNLISQALQRAGVRPDDRVAVMLERSARLIAATIGVMKSGGTYVPLDMTFPPDRRAFMLLDTQASVLIAEEESAAHLQLAGHTPPVLNPSFFVEDGSNVFRSVATASENLAYIIYTSGTTGVPKGVAMSNLALARLVNWQVAQDSRKALRTLQFSPAGFDVYFQEVFSSMCTGGSLVVVPDDIRPHPVRLLQLIERHRVERVFLPVVALQQLADVSLSIGLTPRSLKEVTTAGEQLRITPAMARFFTNLDDLRLHNHYGPTETHLATSFTLTGDPKDWPSLPPIGTAVAGSFTYIANERLEQTPVGEIGELFLGGNGLARGYHGNPDLTAERFGPDPFSGAKGSRLYRTGDRARMLPDGNLEFVGRADNQIKIRGFRVEPEEVEAVLVRHQQVSRAVVVLGEFGPGDKRLVGVIVPTGDPPTDADLRNYMSQCLPRFMIPESFIILNSLITNATGKVDRKALQGLVSSQTTFIDSESADTLHNAIAEIWTRVLGVDEVDLNDDFFDVGGDSGSAVRVVTEVSALMKRPVDLTVLLKEGTINGMVKALQGSVGKLEE